MHMVYSILELSARCLVCLSAALWVRLTRNLPLKKLAGLFYSEMQLANVKRRGRRCFVGKGSEIIHGEFMEFGNCVRIGPYSRIEAIVNYKGVNYHPKLVIEDGVSTNWFTHIACADYVRIGKNTLIAGSVFITDHNHGYSGPETLGLPPADCALEISPVEIGARCWIGEHVCILPGVTIGDDCIIGAGSIVTRNIPPRTIALGIPARPIKQRDSKGKWVTVT